jgi:hypothetical protein
MILSLSILMSALAVPATSAYLPGARAAASGAKAADRILVVHRTGADGIDVRAMLADPVIRWFVGLSDYAWDFNSPNTIPGFASLPSNVWRQPPRQLSAEEAARLASGPPATMSVSLR